MDTPTQTHTNAAPMPNTTERLAALVAEHREDASYPDTCVCGDAEAPDPTEAHPAPHVAAVLAEAGVGFVGEVGRDESEGWASYAAEQERHDETKAALDDLRARVEVLAEHWHWDDDEVGAFRCGYVERREPCPIPERLYVFTPSELAADRARVWDEGEAALAARWEFKRHYERNK